MVSNFKLRFSLVHREFVVVLTLVFFGGFISRLRGRPTDGSEVETEDGSVKKG